MFRRRRIRLGIVANIPIHLHVGSLFLIPLGILVMALEPMAADTEWPPLRRWLLAVVTSMLMALSVFLHDAGHLLVAAARKIRVRRLILYPFGGVYQLGRTPITSSNMVQLVLAGPLVSLLLAGLWLVAWWVWGTVHLLWLAQFNLLLMVLNLMPTPPFDGGHLLWLLPGHAVSPQGGTPIAFLTISILLLGLMLPGGTALLIGLLLSDATSIIGGILLIAAGCLVIEAPAQTVHVCTPAQQRWLHQTTVAQVILPVQSAAIMEPRRNLATPGEPPYVAVAAPARHDVLPGQRPFPTLEPWVVAPTTSLLQALHKLDASSAARLLVVVDGRIIDTITTEQIFAPFKQAENLLQLKAESLILLQPNEREKVRT